MATSLGLAVAAVGQINDLTLAGELVANGRTDAVTIGRPLLRDPYFALRKHPTAKSAWPHQYQRAL